METFGPQVNPNPRAAAGPAIMEGTGVEVPSACLGPDLFTCGSVSGWSIGRCTIMYDHVAVGGSVDHGTVGHGEVVQ